MSTDTPTLTDLDPAGEPLDPQGWVEVRPAVHMVAQIVGKVALAANPYRNQWWECGLRLTPQGFRTPLLIAPGDGIRGARFDIDVDLVRGALTLRTPRQSTQVVLDGSVTVADLYHRVVKLLASAGIDITLDPTTSEIPHPVQLDTDTRPLAISTPASRAWLHQLHAVDAAYNELLRTYYGKTSEGVLWWGGLDFALSLFNGKPNTPPADANRIYEFAENVENISFSYWTDEKGNAELCAYRTPGDNADANGDYGYGSWSHDRREVVCALNPHGQVASHPQAGSLVAFLQQTLRTLADNGGWDLDALLGPAPAGVGPDPVTPATEPGTTKSDAAAH